MLLSLVFNCCWTGADLQKQTSTESIYSGPDVVQNQYQDLYLAVLFVHEGARAAYMMHNNLVLDVLSS